MKLNKNYHEVDFFGATVYKLISHRWLYLEYDGWIYSSIEEPKFVCGQWKRKNQSRLLSGPTFPQMAIDRSNVHNISTVKQCYEYDGTIGKGCYLGKSNIEYPKPLTEVEAGDTIYVVDITTPKGYRPVKWESVWGNINDKKFLNAGLTFNSENGAMLAYEAILLLIKEELCD